MTYRLPNGKYVNSRSNNRVIPPGLIITDNRLSHPHLTAKSILYQTAQDYDIYVCVYAKPANGYWIGTATFGPHTRRHLAPKKKVAEQEAAEAMLNYLRYYYRYVYE